MRLRCVVHRKPLESKFEAGAVRPELSYGALSCSSHRMRCRLVTCLTMQYPVLSACYCKNVGCNGAYEPQACLMRYNQFLCTEFTKIELYELFIGAQFGFDYRAKQTKSVNIAHNIIAHVGEVNTNLRLTSMEQFYRAGWRSGTVRYGQALRAAPSGDHAVPCTVSMLL